MSVVDGLRRIQAYWPGVTFKMAGEERLDVMHKRLIAISEGPEPRDLIDLIHRMDDAGLGIKDGRIVLFD